MDVGLGVDKLDDALYACQTACNTFKHVLHTFSSLVSSLALEKLNDHLQELDDGDKQGPKGQTAPMVPENHFVAAPDRQAELVPGCVGVVPHAAGRGDDEDSHCSDEGICPEGEEDEDVEPNELRIPVSADCSEVVRRRGDDEGGT